MPYDRFLIAPINGSLQTDLRPWLIPEQSFTTLQNAYIFRGRVRKRFGESLMGSGSSSSLTAPLFSRVAIQVATIMGGAASGTVPGSVFAIGQQFSIAGEIFTVYQTGTPAVMLDTGTTTTKTYNTSTGAFNFAGNSSPNSTPVYFYPDLPIMGITLYELGPVNNEPSFAFDTEFAYQFTGGRWLRSFSTLNGQNFPVFHGTDFQFFWTTNWSGITSDEVVMFITNFNVAVPTPTLTDDPIWVYSVSFTPNWEPFSYSPDLVVNNTENQQPFTVTQTTSGNTAIIANYIQSALIILPFKDRLIMLNTIENNANGATAYDPTNHGTRITTGITPANYLTSTNTKYVNRCRYSHNGSPFATNAWLEPNFTYTPAGSLASQQIADGGGFVDAPTEEAIISAEFIKDRLIVYFERSTWELVYTGNQVLPFVWQKINTELGSESTFSIVPFDKVVLGISNVGVHACNSANVERIDSLIPDEVFSFTKDNNGVQRIAGVRDYFSEMVYWTFVPDGQNSAQVFPSQILLYNYKTGSWAMADDCITAWGYFEQQSDLIWQNAGDTWAEANYTWNSNVINAEYRQVIAGNQQGYIFLVERDTSYNAPVLSITNITTVAITNQTKLTIINHNLNNEDYIYIQNCQGIGGTAQNPAGINKGIYQIAYVDQNNVTLVQPSSPPYTGFSGTYTGGGSATRVSNIQIQSKQLNPYVNKGRNLYLAKVDFCVQKTGFGEITVDYSISSASGLLMVEAAANTDCSLGTNVLETSPYALYPLEDFQERLWHPIYFQADGEFVTFFMYLNDKQLRSVPVMQSDFQLEGFILHTQPTAQRLQ